jgi:carbohydrate kinase (thermoresistant glucokinase family)
MGCGKTTVGRTLAERLGWPFDDADDFHPQENIDKMRAGIPLNDQDRQGWLTILRGRIAARKAAGEHLVLACSALKQKYRDHLGVDGRQVVSVYLRGDAELLRRRIEGRNHHYMAKNLLASQLETMEEPAGGLTLDIGPSPEALAEAIVSWLAIQPEADPQSGSATGRQVRTGNTTTKTDRSDPLADSEK